MFERSVIPLGFIDDLLSLNEDSTFEKHYMGIYPTELELKKKIIAILLFLYIFFSYQFFNNFEWNVCVCVCVCLRLFVVCLRLMYALYVSVLAYCLSYYGGCLMRGRRYLVIGPPLISQITKVISFCIICNLTNKFMPTI